MRISDWSSDVCASGQHFAVGPGGAKIAEADDLRWNLGELRAGHRAGHRFAGELLPPTFGEPVVHHQRSEEHTSELQSLMRISYAVFCLKKKKRSNKNNQSVL